MLKYNGQYPSGLKQQGFSQIEPSVPRRGGPGAGYTTHGGHALKRGRGTKPGAPAPPFGNGSDASFHDMIDHG